MRKLAKSADHKLILLPFLLLLGRSFGIIRFFINMTEPKLVVHLEWWEKMLFTLQVSMIALEVCCVYLFANILCPVRILKSYYCVYVFRAFLRMYVVHLRMRMYVLLVCQKDFVDIT